MLNRLKDNVKNFNFKNSVKSKQTADPAKISLVSRNTTEDGTIYSAPIRVEGFPAPSDIPGSFRWYRINASQDFQEIPGVTGNMYQPNIDDIDCRLSCQFIPDNSSLPPSNFSEIGPLLPDLTIESDAQSIITSEKGSFKIKYGLNEVESVLYVAKKRVTIQSLERVDMAKVKIKNDFIFDISRSKPCQFCIKNSKRTPLVQAETASSRERDILAIVIRSMALKRRHKAAPGDVVQVSIDIVGKAENWHQKFVTRDEEYQTLSDKYLKIQMEMLQFKSRSETLDAEVIWLNNSLMEQANSKHKMAERTGDLETRLDLIVQENSRLKKNKTALEQKIADVEKDKQEASDIIQTHQKTIEQLRKSIEDISKKKFEIEQDTLDFKGTLRKKDEDYLMVLKERDEVRKAFEELKGVNEKLKVDVQALRAALDQEKQTNIKKQTDIDDLRRTMEDFHRASKNDSRHKKELGSKIASLEKQVESQKKEIADFQGANERISELTNDLLTTTAECSRLQSELDYSKKDLESQASKFTNLQEMYNTIRGQHDELQTKSKEMSAEIERSAKMSKEELASLVEEKTELTDELVETNALMLDLKSGKEDLDEEYRKLERQLKSVESDLQEANSSNDRLIAEKNFYKKKTESAMSDINKLMMREEKYNNKRSQDSELWRKTREAEELKTRKNVLERELEEARSENVNLRRDLTLANSQLTDDQQNIVKRNLQLQRLANDLSDAVGDKDQQITHQKSVMKILGDRVRQLEAKFRSMNSEQDENPL